MAQFQQAIEAGLYFESSIPIGYGVGSSGALTAALYDTFGLERWKTEKY
ncbi:MAG: hypothetical protein HC892_05065 [Saprospiraceae bacterium]|nr:hypothetical protein [Saprospiraceae bacterium]